MADATWTEIIARHTVGRTDCATAIAELGLFRRDAPAPPSACLVEPSIVLVVQGQKKMWLGGEGYLYDSQRFLVTSLDLPAQSEVLRASPAQPCLGLVLRLDLRLLAELMAQGHLTPPAQRANERGMGLGTVTPQLHEPLQRLLALLDEPASIPVLSPLILREIHYRLLQSDQAARLWQITAVGSQGQRIAKALEWLKLHYAAPLRVEALAARVQMSPSNFHRHFRKLTAMSPLQYQKWLRLTEAKRLMLNLGLDASSASFRVGYESPSQFSREYSRLFGASPRRDTGALKRGPAG